MLTLKASTIARKTVGRFVRQYQQAAFLLIACCAPVIATQVQALERVDAITLATDLNRVESVLMHPDGQHAYVLTGGNPSIPGSLIKVDLRKMEAVASGLFGEGGEMTIGPTAVMDSVGAYAYVAYLGDIIMAPRLAKIDLATMQRVGAASMSFGVKSIAIDAAGTFAYTGSDEGIVEKTNLATLQSVGFVETGQSFLRSATIDPSGSSAYFGTWTIPGRVVKIDLTTFQWAGVLTLDEGEIGVRSAAVDPTGTAGYFGTDTNPARLVKVDLATFQRTGGLTLSANESFIRAINITPTGQNAYLGTTTYPPRLIEVDLDAFQRTHSAIVGVDDGAVLSLGMGTTGAYTYVGTDDSPGRLLKVALQVPVPNAVEFDPAYVDFHDVVIGGSPATHTVNLRNTGTVPASSLQFDELADGFSADTSACPMPLAVDAACNITVAFAPTVTGVVNPQWGANTSGGATAHLVLRANGVPPSRDLTLVPAVLDFGAVDFGTSSPPMSATLTNTGTQTLTSVHFSTDEDYQFFSVDTFNCPFTMPVGASCTISVTFKPTRVAPVGRSFNVRSSGGAETHLSLAGSGIRHQYALSFDEPSIDFGLVPLGQTGRYGVGLENLGTDEVTQLTLTTTNPEFSVSQVWCESMPAGAYCLVDVAFTPTAAGMASGILHLTTAEGVPAQISLSGIGTGDDNPAHLFFDPVSLAFGAVGIGTLSNARTALLRNDGSGVAIIKNVTATRPEFLVDASECGPALAPNESCPIRVRFAPNSAIESIDRVTVVTDQGLAASMEVSGTGSMDALFQGGFE